ncbi:hypothetical protein H477_1679 [[Clostridium] sordellii ATCC 9714]|nr:hypothetical protein H477_1679 [[Clostridium] sordellii ATCC 9714] [Paeniclostridium sordellii ATCC 9714]
MDYAIKVDKLSKNYQSYVAVDNLSFEVKKELYLGYLELMEQGRVQVLNVYLELKR